MRCDAPKGTSLPASFASRPRDLILLTLVFAAALLWPAAINGGPFWFPDTSTYIRGADAAYVATTGIETAWSGELGKVIVPQSDALAGRSAEAQILASGEVKPVLSGRSVYYGVLLWVPIQLFGAWGASIVQALLVAFSVMLPLRIAVRQTRSTSEHAHGWQRFTPFALLAILALLSPMPYFTNMLIPDIFAGLICLLLGTAIIFWNGMSRWEKLACLGLSCLFVTYHTTLVLLTIASVGVAFLIAGNMRGRLRAIALGVPVLASAIIAAIVFSQGVQMGVGQKPMGPPFLSARLTDAGPGMTYLEEHCGADQASRFALCDYRAQLPMDSDSFLWGQDAGQSFFQNLPTQQKHLLSSEDKAFYLAVLKDDPGRVIGAAFSDTLSLLGKFNLNIFNYSDANKRGFARKLPDPIAADVAESRAAQGTQPTNFTETLMLPVSLIALGLLGIIAVLAIRKRISVHPDAARLAAVLLAAVLANAVICGALSKPHGRYQARIIWLLPIAAGIALAGSRRRTTDAVSSDAIRSDIREPDTILASAPEEKAAT